MAFTRVVIENFQSHKKSELILSNGVNAIVGPSRNGKTAIIRALRWCILNQPSGLSDLLSRWALNDKGKQVQPISVTIDSITRFRDTKRNGYSIGDKELNALGQGTVPAEIESMFNLSSINVQKQLDAPFLLSSSGGEIARFFNTLVSLDSMDFFLSEIEKIKRANNATIKTCEKNIHEYTQQLEAYAWVAPAEKLSATVNEMVLNKLVLHNSNKSCSESIQEYEGIVAGLAQFDALQPCKETASRLLLNFEKMREVTTKIDALQTAVQNYRVSIKNLRNASAIEVLAGKVSQVLGILEKQKAVAAKRSVLEFKITTMTSLLESGSSHEVLNSIKESLQEITKLKNVVDTHIETTTKLSSTVELFNSLSKSIKTLEEDKKQLIAELPDVCPSCGQAHNYKGYTE